MSPEYLYVFFKKHHIKHAESNFLLAVSGGVDSMILAHLFLSAGLNFSVAHCNFKLRDQESDEDESFVLNWCKVNHIRCYLRSFETMEEAAKRGISLQMCARDLRYEWFNELKSNFHFDFLATAHHQNDNIETFFINLFRRSGLKGLKGMNPYSKGIIRPLLIHSKEELLNYADEHNLQWRDDSSNLESKYLRNKIRIKLLPYLNDLFGDVTDDISTSQRLLKSDYDLMAELVSSIKKKYVQYHPDQTIIDLKYISDFRTNSTLLYHLISDYGFNIAQCQDMITSHHNTGAIFYTDTYQALIDRSKVIIRSIKNSSKTNEILIDLHPAIYSLDIGRFLKVSDQKEQIPNWKSIIGINANQVKWPLRLRLWQNGDFFFPLGMHGKKQKLKKYFSNNKINRFDKQKIPLLVDADNQIIWILGYRMDSRFVGDDLFIEYQ